MEIVALRVEETSDGRRIVLGDIPGGERVVFGYLGDDAIHYMKGGSDRVALPVLRV